MLVRWDQEQFINHLLSLGEEETTHTQDQSRATWMKRVNNDPPGAGRELKPPEKEWTESPLNPCEKEDCWARRPYV